MLTKKQILKEIQSGNIQISDFDESRLNPNSYNLRLDNDIRYYPNDLVLDPEADSQNNLKHLDVCKVHNGNHYYLLKPGYLYLAQTMEHTKTDKYIPCISGRSSIGRLGINVHVTAGFGDIGFDGHWTLEIFVINPVLVHEGLEICQIYWFKPDQDEELKGIELYNGKYQGQDKPTSSRMYKELIEMKG